MEDEYIVLSKLENPSKTALTTLKPRKRYNTAPILSSFSEKNNGWKINIRIKDTILDQLGVKIGERLSVSYVTANPKILFLKKEHSGNKISCTHRILVTCPFKAYEIRGVDTPYELKDGGIYLYYNKILEIGE